MTKKFKCAYPTEHGCKLEGNFMQAFELINKKGSSVELLFCRYHHCIVMGGHFKAKTIKEQQNLLGEKKKFGFKLIGPLKGVEITEQVMGAREIMAQLKSDNK